MPKLVEDEEKLLNTQDKLIKQAEVLNNKNEVLQTEYLKVGGRLESLTKFGKEFNEAFTESNKVLGNADAAFDEATKKLIKLGYSAEEIKFNIKELNNGGIAKLSEQAKTLRNTIEENNKTIGNNLQIVDSLTEAYKASGKELGKSGNIIIKAVNGIKTAFKSLGSVVKAALGAIAVTATIALLVKLYEAIRKNVQAAAAARKEAKELRLEVEKGTSGAAKQIVVLKELSEAYKKVGDSADSKKKFIEEYAEKIKETGLAIADVNTADKVFIDNTSTYIDALKSRAKAQAAEALAIKKYQDYLEKRAELEDTVKEKQAESEYAALMASENATNQSAAGYGIIAARAQSAANKAQKAIEDLDNSINKTINNLFDVVEAENAAADATIKPLEDAAKAAADAAKAAADAKAKAEREAKERADAAAKAKAQRDKELEELAKYYKAARDLFKDARTKELDDIREKYDAQIELAKKYGKDTTALEQARQREISEVIKKYNDQALKDQEAATQKQIDAIQTQIERIRKMNDTSNLRFREQNYQTEYRQPGITAGLGLGAA